MNVCVIIPAAGRGRRFGASDKLAQDLGGRPLLLRTVEVFAKRDDVQSILVAGPPAPAEARDAFRNRFGPALGFHGATIVDGGIAERWETVRRALADVPDDATHVAIHDAARPAVPADLIDRAFEAARTLDAVIPAIPIASTVKRVEEDVADVAAPEDDGIADAILGDVGRTSIAARRVLETIARDGLVAVQTPQVFEVGLLRRAYDTGDPAGATDDATLVERLGVPVHVVAGDPANVKVTTPADLRLVCALLDLRPPAERPVHKRF